MFDDLNELLELKDLIIEYGINEELTDEELIELELIDNLEEDK